MNIVYKLKWRRGDFGLWHSAKVVGHQYETGSNKLILYFPDGGLREIAHWNNCEMVLGSDWSKLTIDESGNTVVMKEKLKFLHEKDETDIIPPEPDPSIKKTSEKEEETSEKEEELDDRTSS